MLLVDLVRNLINFVDGAYAELAERDAVIRQAVADLRDWHDHQPGCGATCPDTVAGRLEKLIGDSHG